MHDSVICRSGADEDTVDVAIDDSSTDEVFAEAEEPCGFLDGDEDFVVPRMTGPVAVRKSAGFVADAVW